MDISWLLFLAASVALIATPGQDLLLVMSRSVTQGGAAGLVTALGISSGLVVHTALVAMGLGVILQTSEWLYYAVKTAGAGYLVYLGVRTILAADNALFLSRGEARSLPRLFVDGALCNIANPKVAIFFLAFLPQFVSTDSAHPTAALLALGLALAALTFVIKGPIALFAGRLSTWLRRRPAVLSWMHRASGTVLIALGIKLALERRA
jgi:threonine/homoserine/homoserine lactone efflux protein